MFETAGKNKKNEYVIGFDLTDSYAQVSAIGKGRRRKFNENNKKTIKFKNVRSYLSINEKGYAKI